MAKFTLVMRIEGEDGDQTGEEYHESFDTDAETVIDWTLAEAAERGAYLLYEDVVLGLKYSEEED